jgi:hypothetical protein
MNLGMARNDEARAELERARGEVWNTDEMQRDFTVLGFMAPFVVVERKVDHKRGSLEFSHSPRFYWGFREDA